MYLRSLFARDISDRDELARGEALTGCSKHGTTTPLGTYAATTADP